MEQINADLVEIDQDAENAKYEEQHKAKQPLINELKQGFGLQLVIKQSSI